jgi:hypothetical protein
MCAYREKITAPELLAHAAPDMLAALKAIEDWWISDGMHHHTGAPYAIFAVRAAIAKATAYDPEPPDLMRRFEAAIKAIKEA